MAGDILQIIVEHKKEEVQEAKKRRPEHSLLKDIDHNRPGRSESRFFKQLSKPGKWGVNIIAEIKRASPSRGIIRGNLDPAEYAREYEKGGASAISVLTDEHYFRGSTEDLKRVKETVSLPVLRKDFIISSYQIYESVCIGADAVLLIKKILGTDQLKDYLCLCDELKLDALVEVHSGEEIEAVQKAGARLVGINNRNLNSFETNVETSIRLAGLLEPGQVCVAESGIKSRGDIENLRQSGIHNVLIGESIVRAPNTREFIQTLVRGSES